MHICRCKDPGHDQLFHLMINELHSWIESTLGNRVVAMTIGAYLCARREMTMQSLLDDTCADMILVSEHSDRLGWDSFLEGRITQHWLLLVAPFLRRMPRNLLPQSWGQQFIQRLHKFVHKQWKYRNKYIHFKGKEGWTMTQIQNVFDQITEYWLIDRRPRNASSQAQAITWYQLWSPRKRTNITPVGMVGWYGICIVSLHTISTGVPNTTGSHIFLHQQPLFLTQSETSISHGYVGNTGMRTRTLGSVLMTGMVGCGFSFGRRQDICNSATMLLWCGCSCHPAG